MLQIKGLSKTYDKVKKAVDQLTLHVEDGEIFGFIGHNGAGKTTTIKSVVGILDFEEGEIYVDGINIKESPLLTKQRIAYLPDNPDIYESLTGIGYLNFIGDIYKLDASQKNADVELYSNMFEMTDKLGDLISTYSHGMKQKLALISALIRKPRLMILDEPFVGLDPKAAFTIKKIMKEMCQTGTSIFFSTHVLEVAEKLCDRIAIIKNGKIVLEGKTQELIKDQSLETTFLEYYENE